jgi:hypothetical protein
MPEADRLTGTPENIGKEWMSVAYMRAICAQVGLNLSRWEFDNGIDWAIGSIQPIDNNSLANFSVGVQLKATENWQVEDDGCFKYSLPVKNYNLLRCESHIPQYLIVFTLPSELESWVKYRWQPGSHDHIVEIRHMAYYLSLRGQPPTDNEKTITIRIPVSNVLTSEVLRSLYEQHSQNAFSWATNQGRNGQ